MIFLCSKDPFSIIGLAISFYLQMTVKIQKSGLFEGYFYQFGVFSKTVSMDGECTGKMVYGITFLSLFVPWNKFKKKTLFKYILFKKIQTGQTK